MSALLTQDLIADRDRLRFALCNLCGVKTIEEINDMETILRAAPVPMEDKAAMIDALHAIGTSIKLTSGAE